MATSERDGADLDAARAAAREARERAGDVSPCEFSMDTTGHNDDATWVFAEIYSDFHKGRYLYLRAPADVVDTTPGECFAHAIIAARTDVPALAAHVDALANEAERLRAHVAELETDLASWREASSKLSNERAGYVFEWMRLRAEVLRLGGRPNQLPRAAAPFETGAVEQTCCPFHREGGWYQDSCRSELITAAPPGHRVAALLADLKHMREEGDGDMREAIEAVLKHLGTPSPLDAAVAEVLEVDALALGEQEMLITIDELNRELFHDNPAVQLVTLRKLGAVALRYLAGLQACDAPAPAAAVCPSALMHSTRGRLPCILLGAHTEHNSATGERWGSEDFTDHPDFDTRAFFDDGAATTKGGG